jgi:hypothetical protein
MRLAYSALTSVNGKIVHIAQRSFVCLATQVKRNIANATKEAIPILRKASSGLPEQAFQAATPAQM